MKKIPFTTQGFTIIETLVAVAILMISIAGPLTIAHKGLLAAVYAHDQVTASYLAQDAMEYIQNMKAINVRNGNWLADLDLDPDATGHGLTLCTASTICYVDTTFQNATVFSPTHRGVSLTTPAKNSTEVCDQCVLKNDATGYNYGTGTVTKFSRYFYLVYDAAHPDEAKVVVVVNWLNGGNTQQVLYESEIFNVQP